MRASSSVIGREPAATCPAGSAAVALGRGRALRESDAALFQLGCNACRHLPATTGGGMFQMPLNSLGERCVLRHRMFSMPFGIQLCHDCMLVVVDGGIGVRDNTIRSANCCGVGTATREGEQGNREGACRAHGPDGRARDEQRERLSAGPAAACSFTGRATYGVLLPLLPL